MIDNRPMPKDMIQPAALAHPEPALALTAAVPLLDEQPNPCPACAAPLWFAPEACEEIVEARWMEESQTAFTCPACGAKVAIEPRGGSPVEDGVDGPDGAFIKIGPPRDGFWIGVVEDADAAARVGRATHEVMP